MTEAKPHPSDRRPEGQHVLVVDDEPDVAFYLSSVLEDAGLTVRVAHDGEQAIAAIEERVPDLISLDLVMPRASGIRVLRELRRRREWRRIPVIIVTAHARDPEVRADLDEVLADSTMAGPSLYLEKPVTPHGYLGSVCKVLGVEVPSNATGGDSHQKLREEARELLERADAATLEAVLGRLRRDRSEETSDQ